MKEPRKTPTGRDTAIISGQLYFEDARQCAVDSPEFAEIVGDGYTNAIRVISLSVGWELKEWVTYDASIVSAINVQMTLRREVRSGRGYWYAYRRVMGKLHKKYVGTDEEITEKRILDIARKLPSL